MLPEKVYFVLKQGFRGSTPEPPKILSENTATAVSGHFCKATQFLPGLYRFFRPVVTYDGNHMFFVNQKNHPPGNFEGFGLLPKGDKIFWGSGSEVQWNGKPG